MARRSTAGRSAAAIGPTWRWRSSAPGSPTPPPGAASRPLTLAELIGAVRDIRRLGSAALDLCYVAAGRYDAYFETGLNSWDAAAGELIAREAGCRSGDHHGGPAQPGELLVATPAIFAELQARLAAATALTIWSRADRCGGIASAIGHHGCRGNPNPGR